jgi:serine/threonine-protein kinase
MPVSVGEAFAGFTILRVLGAGGMGTVYLAAHPRLPRQDAQTRSTGSDFCVKPI